MSCHRSFLRVFSGCWSAGLAAALLLPGTLPAVILWSDLGDTLVHDTGNGHDILGGAVRRDDRSSDTLYFKFHLDPLSDVSTEEYFAALQLFDDQMERLAVGNSLKAWAYSAFNTAETGEGNKVFGDVDLRSSRPESSAPGVFLPYELPRRGIENTIVFKVQFVPGADDRVTVWLNPDLSAGATEATQPENLSTRFAANASFNQIRLRHGGGGPGWTFSDLAVATAFGDLVHGVEPAATNGPVRGTLQMTFRTWQREQGLPQSAVRALAQTPDGYLWLGHDEGVTRFDGLRFVSFGAREGVRSGRVRVLFADRAGALWIGTVGGGLMRLAGGAFTAFGVADGLPSENITALAEDAEGWLWVGTEAGLAVHQEARFVSLPGAKEFKGRRVTAIRPGDHGVMWLGVEGLGVFRYGESRWSQVTNPAVESLLKNSHCLLEDREGRLWLGAGEDTVLCREAAEWRRYRIPRHLARPFIGSLAEGPDGSVWAGSVSEGLFQFKAGKLGQINASTGLSDNFVEALLVDREGNLWVGTGAGLNRLARGRISLFGQNEGLGYGPVRGLAEVSPGVIWAAKPGDGIFQWTGRSFNRLAGAEAGWRAIEVSSLLTTRDGSCWVAGAQGLVQFLKPAVSGTQPDRSFLPGRNVTALLEDHFDGLWAGTQSGELWRCRGGAWEEKAAQELGRPITSLAQSRDGSLWVGTDGGGLFRVAGGECRRLDLRQGLVSDSIRALHLDSREVLWIGTAGGGLGRYAEGRIRAITTREGLADDSISQVLEDDLGRLWLGSSRGIMCVAQHELDDLSAGRIKSVYPLVIGRTEGLPSEECTGGFQPAGLRTKHGWLWFPTLKGIAVTDPRQHTEDPARPTVVLEEVWVDGTPVAAAKVASLARALPPGGEPANEGTDDLLELGPGRRQIEFHFTGLSFSAPERVRFRYRLEGLDPNWVEAGTRRSAPYSYLPPGEYRFRVIACNSRGAWSEMAAGLRLRVRPYFWEARWFVVVLAAAVLGCVAGAVRLVEKRKHQRRVRHLEQERAVERERARIAQDLHDDLGSSLTRLSLLGELLKADKDSPVQVELHAQKISQSAGQTVRALEEIVWALRPGSDTLQSLIEYIAHFANELFEGDAARCRLEFPPDLPAQPLPPEMRHNIFLIVKEALTNALKHAGAVEVRVTARATATTLEIEIADDGRGFDSRQPPAPGKRQGLGNMQNRAATMGGQLSVTSGAGRGTVIKLKVNFPAHTTPAGARRP